MVAEIPLYKERTDEPFLWAAVSLVFSGFANFRFGVDDARPRRWAALRASERFRRLYHCGGGHRLPGDALGRVPLTWQVCFAPDSDMKADII